MNTTNNGWMDKYSLGSLERTERPPHQVEEGNAHLTKISPKYRNLLEDYRSKLITTKEFQTELAELRASGEK